MTGELEPAFGVLLLGMGLGFRHAADADHVVVMCSLVQRERVLARAVRVAALWGLGHTTTFLGLGLLVVLAGVTLPEALEQTAELLVAAMLIGVGSWHLVQRRAVNHAPVADARSVVIGLVHGLAGSAGIALLAGSTIESRPLAVAYLALVAAGTVLGMAMLTVVLSVSLRSVETSQAHLRGAIATAAALLSIGLGLGVLVGA